LEVTVAEVPEGVMEAPVGLILHDDVKPVVVSVVELPAQKVLFPVMLATGNTFTVRVPIPPHSLAES
jgi:hypothetical protein